MFCISLSFYSPFIVLLFSPFTICNWLVVSCCYHAYLIHRHGKETFLWKGKCSYKTPLARNRRLRQILYVDTAHNGFLLHVLIYHLHMWLSILHLVFWGAGAQEGGRCNTAPGVRPPSLGQGCRSVGLKLRSTSWRSGKCC